MKGRSLVWNCGLCFLVLLLTQPSFALDRTALAISSDLHLILDPTHHALGAEGTVELHNVSNVAQNEAALQISSSLHWLAMRTAGGRDLEWLTQSYTSDIDHTGELSEAIVKLPAPLEPGASTKLSVRYAGAVDADATRLERIGTPRAIALRSDWDAIGDSFSAVRGAGFVAWYPVAMPAASLSHATEVFETLRQWRARQHSMSLRVRFERLAVPDDATRYRFVANGVAELPAHPLRSTSARTTRNDTFVFRDVEPTFALLSEPAEIDHAHVAAYFTAAHTAQARDLITSTEAAMQALQPWLGAPQGKMTIVELGDLNALPYQSGAFYFVPLRNVEHAAAEVALARPVANLMFRSPRPWIADGLASFAQVLVRERQAGRRAALVYLGQFRAALAVAQAASHPATTEKSKTGDATPAQSEAPNEAGTTAPQPLIATNDELFYRTKAAYVWWMLRDMLGDTVLSAALHDYRAADDRDPAYLERLLQDELARSRPLSAAANVSSSSSEADFSSSSSAQDSVSSVAGDSSSTAEGSATPLRAAELTRFFDDWVYHDRGLPVLRADAANMRTLSDKAAITAVTVENRGEVWCQVPVLVGTGERTVSQRVTLAPHTKITVRLSSAAPPNEAYVNDGSVPEAEVRDNRVAVHDPEAPAATTN